MPASYQGVILRSAGDPILDLNRPLGMSDPMQRRVLDTLKDFNTEHEINHQGYSELGARVSQL